MSGEERRDTVPPGYKMTEVGVIPEDWATCLIDDIVTRVGSGNTPRGGALVYSSEGIPFVRSQNVGDGVLDLDDLVFISEEIHATFPASQVEADDVLLNITGASIGRSAVADDRVAHGNVNQHVCEIRVRKTAYDPLFLNEFLRSANGQSQIDAFQAGGNRQGLNYQQVRSMRLPQPRVVAQRAIAEALSDVDNLLDALDRLITKKRAVKQAAMQQLLTGKTRLPGFAGEWEETTLGEIGTLSKGAGISRTEVVSEGLPCIRYGEIYTHHDDVIRTFYSFITDHTASRSVRLKRGDLLFAGSGETRDEIGKCVGFDLDAEAYAGGDTVILSQNIHDVRFLGYLFNTPEINVQKAQMGQGDAVVHISARSLAQVAVRLPPLPEQSAIAEVLSNMDDEIAALEKRRDKTRRIKEGMMQELLTGRIRLLESCEQEWEQD
ncbi:MAG: restriction endonuclease subunit S [Spirochaeta sp.]|jgi:type I restriction enzyme S subunit|nr:restriction endonuclease subunit S [Spirochaeta sp.]